MLRPVTPGHVAVRPRPTERRPEAWCIVTLGPVTHYQRPVEQDCLLHAYEFVSRDIALYAARHIIRSGWLPTCDDAMPNTLGWMESGARCLHPLGHDGRHSNGYYRWNNNDFPEREASTFTRHVDTSPSEPIRYYGQDEVDRCTATDPWDLLDEGIRCQLQQGHGDDYHVHVDPETGNRSRWLDETTADRMQGIRGWL